MRWSYSRVSTYEDCPYRWFLEYIHKDESSDMFYASYGKFIHEIIDGFYKGKYKEDELLEVYLKNFHREVLGKRPRASIVKKYVEDGARYFQNFKPFPFEKIETEMEVDFEISRKHFIGYIDYLGKDEDGFVIIDNKSRALRQRSKNNKSQTDRELDRYLVQLYIYSKGVKDKYGEFPKYLCFNCFRNGNFIKETFKADKYEESLEWAEKTISKIEHAESFPPDPGYFKCRWLCGVNDECDFH